MRKDVGRRQVPAAIEQVAINDVVDARNIRRCDQYRKRELLFGNERLHSAEIARAAAVDSIHADTCNPKSRRPELRLISLKKPELLHTRRRCCSPEIQEQKSTTECLQLPSLASMIRKGEIRSRQRVDQPGLDASRGAVPAWEFLRLPIRRR